MSILRFVLEWEKKDASIPVPSLSIYFSFDLFWLKKGKTHEGTKEIHDWVSTDFW